MTTIAPPLLESLSCCRLHVAFRVLQPLTIQSGVEGCVHLIDYAKPSLQYVASSFYLSRYIYVGRGLPGTSSMV